MVDKSSNIVCVCVRTGRLDYGIHRLEGKGLQDMVLIGLHSPIFCCTLSFINVELFLSSLFCLSHI